MEAGMTEASPHGLAKRSDLSELRKEADTVKQCFTQFSFQALVTSTAVMGVIANFGHAAPEVNFASGLLTILLLSVARIGTHKYATANRIYGFQLFVERLGHMSEYEREQLTDATSDVGWEEAVRAWRIVQASVFQALYTTRLLPNHPTKRNRAAIRAHKAWWDVKCLIEPRTEDGSRSLVSYHAGSYLGTMLGVLYIFLFASWIPLVAGCIVIHGTKAHWLYQYQKPLWAFVGFFILSSAYVAWCINDRRRLLEGGLLSIHSCSITWEAVVVAHNRSLKKLGHNHLSGYTRNIAQEVRILLAPTGHLEDIHQWFKPEATAAST